MEWIVSQPSKEEVRRMCRPRITEHWLNILREQATKLVSLRFLRTEFLGLQKCHPIFRLCSFSSWEVHKATIRMKLLSGRYRLEAVTRFWDNSNPLGLCKLPHCWSTEHSHKADIESFLNSCPSLSPLRNLLTSSMFAELSASFPHLVPIVQSCLEESKAQFWIDLSTMPAIIREVQHSGEGVLRILLKYTRNYCFCLHKERIRLLT